jgi:hypothetical protein
VGGARSSQSDDIEKNEELMKTAIVGKVGLVVHYKLVFNEVETIRSRLIWAVDHFINCKINKTMSFI